MSSALSSDSERCDLAEEEEFEIISSPSPASSSTTRRRRVRRRRDDNAVMPLSLDDIPILDTLEKQTGVPRLQLVMGGFAAACIVIATLFGARAFSNFVAFVYPAYMTFKTIEQDDEKEHVYWLTYWVVYGLFSVAEAISDVLLFWLPYYYPLKLGFLVWCFVPKYRGCVTVYEHIIRPLLARHQGTIEMSLNQAQASIDEASAEVKATSSEFLVSVSKGWMARSLTAITNLSQSSGDGDRAAQYEAKED